MFTSISHIFRDAALRNYTAALMLSGVAWAATSPFYSLLAIVYLGLSSTTASLLYFGTAVAGLVAGFLITASSDLVRSPIPLILLTLVAGAAGYGAIGLYPSATMLFVMYMMVIPISNASYDLFFACIRSASERLDKAKAVQVATGVRSLYALIWIAVPAAVGLLITQSNVPKAWLIAGCASALCIPLFVLGASRSAPPRETGSSKDGLLSSIRQIMTPLLMAKVLCVGSITASQRMSLMVLPLIVVSLPGGSASDVGVFFGLTAALEVPCMLLWGRLAGGLGVRWSLVTGTLVFGLYLVFLGFAGTFTVVYLIAVLNALGLSAILSMPISYFHESIPSRPGLGSSLNVVMDFCANALTALLFWIGLTSFGYSGTAFLAAGCAIVGAVGVVLVPHRTDLPRDFPSICD